MQHRSRVTKFLMGLNESYEQIRRHILMLKPIPSIEEAYNMVAQDERQRMVKPAVKPDNVAFQASSSFDASATGDNSSYGMEPYEYIAAYNTYRPRNNRPMCTHCGKMGHTLQTCFKVHGYPPGFKTQNSSTPVPYGNKMGTAPRNPVPVMNQGQFPNQGQFTNQGQYNQGFVPRPRTVANVQVMNGDNGGPMLYYPPPTMNAVNLDVSQLTPGQAQDLIQQLSRVQVSEPMINQITSVQSSEPVVSSSATITESGVMAPQSSSGVFSGMDDWEC
ncbi:uncharacterized protein LOC111831128 [Capsella rubella]|uniref:uncharacterized protein LOC111831128 n=1 Tax=Capsella rubella TaxID=81985 RepID=UPI000CD59E2E|nr:uncharacterized protein LOC111831128 [Capsella rubella]